MGTQADRQLGVDIEHLIVEFFSKRGITAKLSSDKFDADKDLILTVNGEDHSLENKLETRFHMFNSFTVPISSNEKASGIHSNQLSKCMNVDILIFCQRPEPDDPVLRIYSAPSLGKRNFVIRQNTRDKRYVAHFPIDKMTLIGTITDMSIVQKYMRHGVMEYAKSF
jgi:hypothetical protein